MNLHTPAASAAIAQPPMGAAADCPPTAADRGAAASHSIGTARKPSSLVGRDETRKGAAAVPNRPSPFAGRDLWQAFRFVGYFQRETVAVFADSNAAVDFCLANIGGQHGNGYFVAEYRRAA